MLRSVESVSPQTERYIVKVFVSARISNIPETLSGDFVCISRHVLLAVRIEKRIFRYLD